MDAVYYREKLNECHREADAATDVNDKVAWLEQASAWLELLAQAAPDGPVTPASSVSRSASFSAGCS